MPRRADSPTTNGPTMKIPVPGQTPPTPDKSTQTDKASPTRPGPTSGSDGESVARPTVSPRQLLDQLQLRQSQQVLARVSQVLEKTASNPEQLLLEVRGKSLVVNSDTRLQPGDWVKIMRAGNELRLMGQVAPDTTPQARIAQQLAQHLPWQHRLDQGLGQLARALQTLSSPPADNRQTAVAPQIRQALEQLVSQLPQAGKLQRANTDNPVDTLKAWVRDSGLFAESRLAQAPASPPADLKLALNRLVTALLNSQNEEAEAFNRYVPLTSKDLVQSPLQFPQAGSPLAPPPPQDQLNTGQMLRLLAGMLNRITVNQLHSQTLTTRTTADAPVATPTWLLELPWLDAQNQPRTAQLRLEHDGEDADSNRPKRRVAEWRLTLAMDLDEAGAVTFELGIQQQQVSARIWAEKTETLRRANEELPQLRQRLGDLGLDVVELECRRGQPQGAKTQLDHRLVDIRA